MRHKMNRVVLLGNGHDEGIDATAREHSTMRISQCADACLVIVTRHDQVHFGLGARIFAMASEHDQLVQIGITLDIVG